MSITQNNIRRWSPRAKFHRGIRKEKGESAVDSRSPEKGQCAELQGRHCETVAEGENHGGK